MERHGRRRLTSQVGCWTADSQSDGLVDKRNAPAGAAKTLGWPARVGDRPPATPIPAGRRVGHPSRGRARDQPPSRRDPPCAVLGRGRLDFLRGRLHARRARQPPRAAVRLLPGVPCPRRRAGDPRSPSSRAARRKPRRDPRAGAARWTPAVRTCQHDRARPAGQRPARGSLHLSAGRGRDERKRRQLAFGISRSRR